MDSALQIFVSGLTLGAMYALATISLSLVWGSLNMLNMAQGAMLTVGGYAAYGAVVSLGLPYFLGIPVSMLVGGFVGYVIYFSIVQFMVESSTFETGIIIATIGIALVLESIVLALFGAYPFAQPVMVEGGFVLRGVSVGYKNLMIIVVSVTAMCATAWLIRRTRLGRAIRATAQNRDAAQLMGVPVRRVYAQVLVLAGMLSSLSGVMLSTITTLAPTMGYDPMIKAFIICVVAGLGNTTGALYAAFLMGGLEATVQYLFGVRFGLPVLLLVVIVTLIWRPQGLFGRQKIVRL